MAMPLIVSHERLVWKTLHMDLFSISKYDISNGFYCVDLNVEDIPKLGVAFPTVPGAKPLVAFSLVLPMGWKNSPSVFSTATETIANLANQYIHSPLEPEAHQLDDKTEAAPFRK